LPFPGAEVRAASVNKPDSLVAAFAGAAAVINCAGPFADTSPAVIDAALHAGLSYVDVTAEQAVALAAFERDTQRAQDAGVAVVPAAGFYGGLGDLLATVAMGDWESADDIRIGIALDSWRPTRGTRLTIARNTGRHMVFADNEFQPPPAEPSTVHWSFPAPFGRLAMTELSVADQVTISRHLRVREIRAYLNEAPLADLRDPETPEPTPVDDRGRSGQAFLVEVIVRRGGEERRAAASGQDIYAVTAPIVVETVARILDGRAKATGVVPLGALVDADDALRALSPHHLTYPAPSR
jgi:hypothetical protein